MSPRLRQTLFILLPFAGCLVLYVPMLTGIIPTGADLTLFYAPLFAIPWDGGFPMRYPGILAGATLYDNLQAALLYPPRWPFFFIDDWRSWFGPFHFLHYLIAAYGMLFFLRGMQLGRLACLTGALLFALGGHMAGRIINPTIFYAACWLPVLFYGALGTEARHRWITFAGFAMILAIGSPHITLYGPLGYAVVWLTMGGGSRGGIKERALNGFFMLAWAVGAVAVFAPTFIEGVRRAGESIRQFADVTTNLSDSVGWGELVKVFLGGTGGTIYPEYIDKSCYVGAAALLLILASALTRDVWRDRRWWCGWGLVVLGLFFALGKNVGLHWVMPHVPGFDRLAGPARALALSAMGLSVLVACALDMLVRMDRDVARRRAVWFGGAALAVGILAAAFVFWQARDWQWLLVWMAVPRAVPPVLWLLLDAAIGLVLLGTVSLGLARNPRLLGRVIAGIVLVQVAHFYPRVAPPMHEKAWLDPPAQVGFLQDQYAKGEPFRIAGIDALRRHDTDMNEHYFRHSLLPNMAAVYGLEDIQGFDPLIRVDYRDRIKDATEMPPYVDKVRGLKIDRPDRDLFRQWTVRYLIGNPWHRRLNAPTVTITPQQTEAPTVYSEVAPTTRPITQWMFVSLVDRAPLLPNGHVVAQLEVTADEGVFRYPVRVGMETGYFRLAANAPGQVVPHEVWEQPTPDPGRNYVRELSNWRGRIDFGRPLHVESVRWRLVEPRCVFHVATQAVALEPTADEAADWSLAFKDSEGWMDVWELSDIPPRAQIVDGDMNPLDGAVRWVEHGPNHIRLDVRTEADDFQVLVRERYFPRWEAGNKDYPDAVLSSPEGFVLLSASSVDQESDHCEMGFRGFRLVHEFLPGMIVFLLLVGFEARGWLGRSRTAA